MRIVHHIALQAKEQEPEDHAHYILLGHWQNRAQQPWFRSLNTTSLALREHSEGISTGIHLGAFSEDQLGM